MTSQTTQTNDHQLPSILYVRDYYKPSEYVNLSSYSPLLSSSTLEEFTTFLKEKSLHRENSNILLANLNNMHLLYIDPIKNYPHFNFKAEDYVGEYPKNDHNPTHINSGVFSTVYTDDINDVAISTELLKTTSPSTYESLLKGQTVIIAYCLHHSFRFTYDKHDDDKDSEVHIVDFIESIFHENPYLDIQVMHSLLSRISINDEVFIIPRRVELTIEHIFWSNEYYPFAIYKNAEEFFERIKLPFCNGDLQKSIDYAKFEEMTRNYLAIAGLNDAKELKAWRITYEIMMYYINMYDTSFGIDLEQRAKDASSTLFNVLINDWNN